MQQRGVPCFRGDDGCGGRFGTADILQRQDFVLGLLHGAGCALCQQLLGELGRRRAELIARGAFTLVTRMAAPEGEVVPVVQVWDPGGEIAELVSEALGVRTGEAHLVVADRFGAVFADLPVHGWDASDLVTEATGWIDFIAVQCPECGSLEV